jgi:hypothetical protein
MIVGRNPRTVVIGDTVLSRNDYTRGAGVFVDADVPKYKIYWRRMHQVSNASGIRGGIR